MKLSELIEKRNSPDVPQLAPSDYSLLWHCGFWDGPISGLLICSGKEYWFEMFQENENWVRHQWYRRYAVVSLTPQQLAREHQVHEDFRKHVGFHCDYQQNNNNAGKIQPREQWHLFYDKHLDYCRSRRFEECEVVAWFET